MVPSAPDLAGRDFRHFLVTWRSEVTKEIIAPRVTKKGSLSARQRAYVLGIFGVLVVALGLASVLTRVWPPSPKDYTRNDFTQDYVSARE